ncbi:GerW family sporulation protein [Natrinema gelatinilyticum]|uniref:GerW family sporulation protein n=1 Tax=Natrinema gelatinilyticum TaxID=2961571 RepID=UPI0020C23D0E|nr:spore germination protein GerW family protein [Natrinema gelatinilyticum]
MNSGDRLSAFVDRVQDHAGVAHVYGDPITHNEKKIIPVARVAYGFGGGYGPEDGEDAEALSNERENSEGAGMGGGVWATPAGVVEITDANTRFISYNEKMKLAIVASICLILGYLLGRK